MNSIVCLKEVPDTETRIEVRDGKVVEEGVQYVVNPYDEYALEEALNALPAEDKFRSEFLFFMSFSDLMDAAQVTRLIDDRIDTVRSRQALLAETNQDNTTAGQEFVLGYGRAMLEASLKFLQENRSLVEAPSMKHAPVKKTNGATSPTVNQDQ